MKILVSITSYKKEKEEYLLKILSEYEFISKKLSCSIDILLTTNYTCKIIYKGNLHHVVTNFQELERWEYCWENKIRLIEMYHDYDYLIESDDDILISEKNITNYIKLKDFNQNYIPGFIITEFDQKNVQYIQSMLFGSSIGKTFIEQKKKIFVPENIHSACSMVDRNRMYKLLSINKNLTIPKFSDPYDMGCMSVSEIYFYYKKIIDTNNFNDHLVNHLTSKYINGKYEKKYFPNEINHLYRPVDYWKSEIIKIN